MLDRSLHDLPADETGQLTLEYMLAALVFVVPLLAMYPMMTDLLYANFYRIVGVLSLPFA